MAAAARHPLQCSDHSSQGRLCTNPKVEALFRDARHETIVPPGHLAKSTSKWSSSHYSVELYLWPSFQEKWFQLFASNCWLHWL